jgi:hypothetical protein
MSIVSVGDEARGRFAGDITVWGIGSLGARRA